MVEPSSDAHEWLGVTIFRKICQVPGHARVYVQELPSAWIQKLHKRFMQGRRADLLIVDDVTDERPHVKKKNGGS